MAQPGLCGDVKLQFVTGFELNDDSYSLSLNETAVVYTSTESSNLRVLPQDKVAETQIDVEICSIECETYWSEDDMQEPRIQVFLLPIAGSQAIETQTITLPHRIKVGPARQIDFSEKNDTADSDSIKVPISPCELVTINTGGFAASFYVDFSSVRETKDVPLHSVVPSSEVRERDMKRRDVTPPAPPTASVSFIKETPSISRYKDQEELDDDIVDQEAKDTQREIKDKNSPMPKAFQQDEDDSKVEDVEDEDDLDNASAVHTTYDDLKPSSSAVKAPTSSFSASLKPRRTYAKKDRSFEGKKAKKIETTYDLSETESEDEKQSEVEKQTPVKKRKAAPLKSSKTAVNKKKRQVEEVEEDKPKKKIRSQSPTIDKPSLVRRGRGRPSKSKEIFEDDTDDDAADAKQPSQVSMTLEKPKKAAAIRTKNKKPAPAADEEADDVIQPASPEKPVAKGRGRPKKQVPTVATESVAGDSEANSNTVSSSALKRSSQRKPGMKLIVATSQSNFADKPANKKFINSYIKVVTVVDETIDVLVIGNGRLSKMPKQLKAILLGKPVISEKWLEQSAKKNKMLPYTEYFVDDPEGQRHWDAAKEWSSGQMPKIEHDFSSTILYITPTLQKSWGTDTFAQMKEIGSLLGFKNVTTFPASSTKLKAKEVLALGQDAKDKDAQVLKTRDGIDVYSIDLLAATIFRGRFELDDEYRLDVEDTADSTTPKAKPGRKKKT